MLYRQDFQAPGSLRPSNPNPKPRDFILFSPLPMATCMLGKCANPDLTPSCLPSPCFLPAFLFLFFLPSILFCFFLPLLPSDFFLLLF